MRIDIYSHNFSVSKVDKRFEYLVKKLAWQTVEHERVKDEDTGEMRTVAVRSYSYANVERSIYRFHISLLKDFMDMVDNVPELKLSLTIKEHQYTYKDAVQVGFDVLKIFPPRDYQTTLIEGAVATTDPTYVVTLPPGGGKTLVSKYVMLNLGVRTFIIMKGGYLDRWIPELEETFKLKRGDLLVVRGQTDLINLMEMQVEGELDAKIIMSTVDTISDFIKQYDKHIHIRGRYPFKPHELFEKLGVGLLIADEVHQNPHKLMRIYSNTNVPLCLPLSATLDTRDPFKNKIYQLMYPVNQRHDAGYVSKHIGANALMYTFRNLRGIRTTGFQGAYSHINFENSLLRGHNRSSLAGYLGLVKYSVDLKFMQNYKPNTKCLLFFATIKMCDKAVKYLTEKYPQFKIVRYTAKDKMKVLEEGDIIVSTVLSAGTAVDIINLRTTIMTTAIDSQISNEQSLGRTRPVRDYPDVTPEFCYFVCTQIPKHLQYHRNKKEMFSKRVKYHTEITLPYAA